MHRNSRISRRVAWPAATKTVSGVRYYGRRYYDPKPGRFVGRDPIGEKGGIHLYAFVRNRPVNTVDVMGMLGLNDALVIDADGGGGYDPIVRMKPFVTAVDSDEKNQRALDAIVANQSISTTIYFNIGGSSSSGKSAEQLGRVFKIQGTMVRGI
jgi:RHS repeat-associated protein